MWPLHVPILTLDTLLLKVPEMYKVFVADYRLIGRPFVKLFTVHPMLSDRCLSVCLSVCDVGVLWPNSWTDQDETWQAGRPRPWPHRVRWGPSSPSPKGHTPAIFGPYMLRPNGCMVSLGMELGLGPGDFVLDEDPAPPSPKMGRSPQFSVHFYCGQTAECIKMPLGMEVGLIPVDFVLDGDPSASQK